MSSADFAIPLPPPPPSLVLELSYMVSSPLGEFRAFSAANGIHSSPMFVPAGNPSLLGGQRQNGMRSLPDTSTHDR